MTKNDVKICAEKISELLETYLMEYCEVNHIAEQKLRSRLVLIAYPTEQRVELLSAKTGKVDFGFVLTPNKVDNYGENNLEQYNKTQTKILDLALGIA